MQMTDAFGSAVAVTIPILALAASTEARAIRERIKRPDEKWEREFAAHRAKHELGPEARGPEITAFFREMPKLPKLFLAERLLAIAGAAVWLAVFVLLTIAELDTLAWLGDGEPTGHGGLAGFDQFCIGATMVVLIAAPTLYILVPLVMPLDLVPDGLKKALAPKVITDKRGRNFLKEVLKDLESTLERAADRVEAAEAAETAEAARTPGAAGTDTAGKAGDEAAGNGPDRDTSAGDGQSLPDQAVGTESR
jgi:hypothetical protein